MFILALVDIGKSNFTVGQFSTAVIEFTYHKIPYYIYEPYENGKTDEMIDSAIIFNRSSVSRNIIELEDNLRLQKPSGISDKDKMFNGIGLSELDFSRLLN